MEAAQSGEATRRAWERQPIDAVVEILSPTATWGRLVDISPAGLGVLIEWPLTTGERCVARVIDDAAGPTLYPAWVAWVTETDDGYRVGLALEE